MLNLETWLTGKSFWFDSYRNQCRNEEWKESTGSHHGCRGFFFQLTSLAPCSWLYTAPIPVQNLPALLYKFKLDPRWRMLRDIPRVHNLVCVHPTALLVIQPAKVQLWCGWLVWCFQRRSMLFSDGPVSAQNALYEKPLALLLGENQ